MIKIRNGFFVLMDPMTDKSPRIVPKKVRIYEEIEGSKPNSI
ncbi:MAG: hypothetical protein QFX36_05475 [Archaeoglobales archaeon]|nr:hypothetical protein [Archaeoglobales archaeon]MDI9642885.1 hypothetical protein [Archaeoglobales archaeon]